MSKRHWTAADRALGMDRNITRRDVLHGLALAGAGALAGTLPLAGRAEGGAPADAAADYPPRWTGLRGSNAGSFEAAHALRDGFVPPGLADTGEAYDLVVVGAGISGLAAAHFYRARAGADARILILDNHDDFGGHARRNEFALADGLHLLNGGTAEIDSPRPYSAVADGLLRTLGIDVPALAARLPNPEFFRCTETQRAVFFDRETFGADKLLVARNGRGWLNFLAESPLNPAAQADILRLERGQTDYFPGRTSAEKKALLAKMSYRDFLRDVARVDPQVLQFYGSYASGEFGVAIDAVSALDCWGFAGDEAPGMRGLKLEPGATAGMGYTPAGYSATGGSYQLHFPDGNATIARLLVRSLIPAVAPPGSVEQLVTQHFDYGKLDVAGAPVRLRLRSTALGARNEAAGAGRPAGVSVDYQRDGTVLQVRARHCVLACYNMIIPYLCPELPEAQKAALHELVKAPLVYTSVALRSGRPLQGLRRIDAPGCYYPTLYTNPYMEVGAYRGPRTADAPTLVHLQRVPFRAGLREKDQNRAGRAELLATPFAEMERRTRDQLGRMLGPSGFDPASDILGLMVNRWPHGYAHEFNPLFDEHLPPAQQPHVIGRARLGRITIANSDSGGGAYTDVAIDQAHRAVEELLGDGAA